MNGKSPVIPGIVRAPQNTANNQFSVVVKNCGIPGVVRAASNIRCKEETISWEKKANGTVQVPQNDELTKQAVDEILRETRASQIRDEQHGPTARKRCPIQRTNKRFLNRTIISAVNHNNRERWKVKQRSREKLTEHVRKRNDPELSRKDQAPPITTIVID
ncbi:protein POLR1D-like [Anopheles aquasalis]|uniref:protein POLR1D-like n=1 Tax=Anopheles aquasalis TaxID=42839 RepID=UPI00215A1513|nr:protein POLR1D-like [Anopheles aquasalis]